MNRTWMHRSVKVLLAAAAAVTAFLQVSEVSHRVARHVWSPDFISSKSIAPRPSVIDGGEDAGSRTRWEWMMLHDPATGKIPEGVRERELEFARSLPKRTGRLAKGAGDAAVTWTARGPQNVGGRTRA
ncbi:MAG: hypothetical protein AABY75_06075, partial [Bacteroidota bacterium]